MEGKIVSTRLAIGVALLISVVALIGCDVKPFSDAIDNNKAPNPRAEAIVIDEDATGTTLVDPNDPDTDQHTFSIMPSPAHGTAEVNNSGLVTYNPTRDFHGRDAFTVVVTEDDNGENEEQGTVVIAVTVHSVDDSPAPMAAAIVTDEEMMGMTQVNPNDPDTDRHTFSIMTLPNDGKAIIDTEGVVTYTPDPDFHGSDTLVVVVTEDSEKLLKGTVEILVTVNPVNNPPNPSADPIVIDEDTIGMTQIMANDLDMDQHIFMAMQPSNGRVVIDDEGVATYMPDPDFNGSDPFVVTVTNDREDAMQGTVEVAVTVNPVNDDPPVPSAEAILTAVNITGTTLIHPNDPDVGQIHDYQIVTGPTHGQAMVTVTEVGAPDELSYVPEPGFVGRDHFEVEVTDNGEPPRQGTVAVNVRVFQPASLEALSGNRLELISGSAFHSALAGLDRGIGHFMLFEVDSKARAPAPLIPKSPQTSSAASDRKSARLPSSRQVE